MHYHIIFDITQTQFPRSQFFAPVLMSVFWVGLILVIWLKRRPGVEYLAATVLATIFAASVGALFLFGVISSHRHYIALKTALQKSQCDVVEGIVTQFQRIPPSHHDSGPAERFSVNGVQFRYREGSAQNGFHQIGIIQNGMRVRIYYFSKSDPIDKDITRLEIAE